MSEVNETVDGLKVGDVVYAQGAFCRIKEILGPDSYSLDILSPAEANACINEIIRKEKEAERAAQEAVEASFRIVYKNGDKSRKFYSIRKIKKYAARKQNIDHVAKFIGSNEDYIVDWRS